MDVCCLYHSTPSPNKFRDVDLIPAVLLKISTDSLICTIPNTLNVSSGTGIFHESFSSADEYCAEKILEHYRPVSNLSFLRNMTYFDAKRLRFQMNSNDLSNVFQSAYKQLNSM